MPNPIPTPTPPPTAAPSGGPGTAFDVDGARAAGYNDNEIAQHLAQTRSFDYAGAQKAGYSPQDVIQHLTAKPPRITTPAGQPTPGAPPVDMQYVDRLTGSPLEHGSLAERASNKGDDLSTPMPGSFEGHPENIGEYVPATVGRAAEGAVDMSRGNIKKGLHKEAQAFGNAIAPAIVFPAAGATIPTAIALASGYGAGKAAKYGTKALGADEDTQNLAEDAGNFAGGIAGPKLAGMPFRSTLTGRSATPAQTEALNALRPGGSNVENFPSSEAAVPEIRNAAAGMAQDEAAAGKNTVPQQIADAMRPNPKLRIKGQGRAGGQKIITATQNAIDAHEAQVEQIRTPYLDETADMSPAASAAISKITPEMRTAAAGNPSGPEARAISQIEALAEQMRGEGSIADIDAKRHRFNDELNPEFNKSEAAQDVSPTVTQAKKAAVAALRQVEYGRLSELSGQDLTPLMRREGNLIETKGDLQARYNAASNSRYNDLSRTQKLARAGMRVNLTKPGTVVRALPELIQALTKEGGTPIGDFNKVAQKAVGNLGPPEPNAAYYPNPEYMPEPGGAAQPPDVQDAELPNGNRGLPPSPVSQTGRASFVRQPALPGANGIPLPSSSASSLADAAAAHGVDVIGGGAHPPSQVPDLIQNFLEGKGQGAVRLGKPVPKANAPDMVTYPVTDASGNKVLDIHVHPETGETVVAPTGYRPGGQKASVSPSDMLRITRQIQQDIGGKRLFGAASNERVAGRVSRRSNVPAEIERTINPEPRVEVINPDGAVGDIPQSQLSDALSKGYKLKNGLQ